MLACLSAALCGFLVVAASVNAPAKRHADPVSDIDWDDFGFGLNGVETDAMWVNTVQVHESQEPSYSLDAIEPMGKLHLSPSETVLNYGQALFEGLKAFRREDGSIVMFRPQMNTARMQQGARRFLLPPVPTDVFVKAAESVVRANARWVPPHQKGALYLRPLLMGTGAGLGVKPSTETTFCIFCSPVGSKWCAHDSNHE